MKIPSTNEFVLRGGGSDFSHKQKTLFDELLQAEKKYKKDQTATVNYNDYDSNASHSSRHTGKSKHGKIRQFQGRESIFKRQGPSISFRRDNTIPDYHKHPHKWTKYSLEDVQNNDMTDNTNTNVALSFLQELRARNSQCEENDIKMSIDEQTENDVSTSSDSIKSTPIVFKKPFPKRNEQKQVTVPADNKSSVFKGSKVILPEYVVGERPKINKTKKPKKIASDENCHQQIKLDHLKDFEDECN
ncbi:protein TSSC4 [Chelonus insularis]|uniref:protein TSSC4 n=1 Tax=Chelonus insularis TaxID=460826 RepID=UPI00158E8A82|nr:protein TSSC4 [Chelonus insularis]